MGAETIVQKLRYFVFERKETIVRTWSGRCIYLWASLLLFKLHLLQGNHYLALSSLLRYERDIAGLAGVEKISGCYRRVFEKFLAEYVLASEGNRVLSSFAGSQEAARIRATFGGFGREYMVRMKYPKKDDDFERQGDLMVLKPRMGPGEKGILFIQYDEGVKRFAALFDIVRLAHDYRFVIEPSSCGYQNPMFFLCLGLGTEVILESQYEKDFKYIASVGSNFLPIRLGAGDWADPDNLIDSVAEEKEYDLVMIANWLKWKRHELLFSAIAKIRGDLGKVALIGYPIDGRNMGDVREECQKHGVLDIVEFHNRIPHAEVSAIIRKSKVGVLLSKEEGANRGIYECFFSGVPVILTDCNRGVNRDHLNRETGTLASDRDLPEVIRTMVHSYKGYRTRNWAVKNTGYINSTRKLNEFFREIALAAGEQWTRDIFAKHNSPHARYKEYADRRSADQCFSALEQYLRSG